MRTPGWKPRFRLRVALHVLVNVLSVVRAEPQLAVHLAREHERATLCLAVTAYGCQILYRIRLQEFYDLAHDKYLHENFIFFFYIGIAFPFR